MEISRLLQSSLLIGISSRDLRCDIPFEEVGVKHPEFRLLLPCNFPFSVVAPLNLAHGYHCKVSWISSASMCTSCSGNCKHLRS
jgi:hypothetical protein